MGEVACWLVAALLAASPVAAPGCGAPGAAPYEPRTFLGYACHGDCRRHKAGLRWAERETLDDPGRCLALARFEAEGCAAYVAEGRDAAAAGERWAIENEIDRACHCDGAGGSFRAGCIRMLSRPPDR